MDTIPLIGGFVKVAVYATMRVMFTILGTTETQQTVATLVKDGTTLLLTLGLVSMVIGSFSMIFRTI